MISIDTQKTYDLKIPGAHIPAIFDGLNELPHKRAREVIDNLVGQLSALPEPVAPTEQTEPTP